jgi:hypothetical protein
MKVRATTPRILSFLLLLSVSSFVASKERNKPFAHLPLTDADVESAVKSGLTLDPEKVGLSFTAATRSRDPLAMEWVPDPRDRFPTSKTKYETTGFVIEVFTPYSWIQREASLRAAEGTGMTPGDVTEEMKEPVLRILCHPDTPLTAQEGVLGIEVENVTIRSTAKRDFEKLEPARMERLTTPHRVGLRVVAEFGPLLAYFPVEEVLRISKLDRKGEFYIDILSDEGQEKSFKVKTKHFPKLP